MIYEILKIIRIKIFNGDKHFRRFNLIESKETDVLRDLEIALRLSDDNVSVNYDSNSSGTTSTIADDRNLPNSSIIDGDATMLPICTQPESTADQSTIRGAGGGCSQHSDMT